MEVNLNQVQSLALSPNENIVASPNAACMEDMGYFTQKVPTQSFTSTSVWTYFTYKQSNNAPGNINNPSDIVFPDNNVKAFAHTDMLNGEIDAVPVVIEGQFITIPLIRQAGTFSIRPNHIRLVQSSVEVRTTKSPYVTTVNEQPVTDINFFYDSGKLNTADACLARYGWNAGGWWRKVVNVRRYYYAVLLKYDDASGWSEVAVHSYTILSSPGGKASYTGMEVKGSGRMIPNVLQTATFTLKYIDAQPGEVLPDYQFSDIASVFLDPDIYTQIDGNTVSVTAQQTVSSKNFPSDSINLTLTAFVTARENSRIVRITYAILTCNTQASQTDLDAYTPSISSSYKAESGIRSFARQGLFGDYITTGTKSQTLSKSGGVTDIIYYPQHYLLVYNNVVIGYFPTSIDGEQCAFSLPSLPQKAKDGNKIPNIIF